MFTCLFTTEILFRVVAIGPTAFVRVPWYLFDAAVVAASLLEYVIHAGGLSIFRTLRMVSNTGINSFRTNKLLRSQLKKTQLKKNYVDNFEL